MKSDKEIYEARKARIAAEADCPPEDIQLTPDVDPAGPQEKCDPVVPPGDPIYLPPPLPPVEPGGPDDLPPGIILSSAEAIVACEPDEVVLAGTNPFIVEAGEVTSLFFLDSLEIIPSYELFRLALRYDDLQAFVDENLRESMNTGDSATYEAALVSSFGVSPIIAQNVWAALISESEILDTTAENIANAGLTCGWLNEPLLLECDSNEALGYSVTVVEGEPADLATDGSQVFIPAGIYQSEISQEDANETAVNAYAGGLICLVGNEPQTVDCTAVDAGFGAVFDWYEGYDTATYGDLQANVVTRSLADLDGDTFYPAELAGSGDGRILVFTSTVEANTVFAATLEEANANANAQAIAALDCFFPSPATLVSCSDPTYGSIAVAARVAEQNYTENEMFKELSGYFYSNGSLIEETSEDPLYTEIEALPQYGIPTENDTYSVGVPPGTFTADDYDSAAESAISYGSSLLFCSWISPRHECFCTETEGINSGESINERNTAKFSDAEVVASGSRYRDDLSEPGNVLIRGTFISSTAPLNGSVLWPELAETCEAALVCIFDACRVAFCAPKPDRRNVNLVHLPNWNSWQPEFIGTPATQGGGHAAFLDRWYIELDNAISATSLSCPIGDYPDVYAECGGQSPGALGGTPFFSVDEPEAYNDRASADISDDGSGQGTVGEGYLVTGAPARFKYGGILKLNYVWGEPAIGGQSTDDEPDATPITEPTIAECTIESIGSGGGGSSGETVGKQDPLLWGHFSGAEGYAVADAPTDLGDKAMMDAISRLDCTHWNWARHFANCPQPNQTALRAGFVLQAVAEAASTQEAHIAAEGMILAEMACFTPSSFALHQANGGASMMAPSVSFVGGTCARRGSYEMELEDLVNLDCTQPSSFVDDSGLLDLPDGASHIFIVLVCCDIDPTAEPDDPDPTEKVKNPAIHIIEGNFSRAQASLANQSGSWGVPSDRQLVKDELSRLQEEDNNGAEVDREVWYIGSAWVGDSLGVDQLGNEVKDMVFVQAHTGPIIIGNSCCTELEGKVFGFLEPVTSPQFYHQVSDPPNTNPAIVPVYVTAGDVSGVLPTNYTEEFLMAVGDRLYLEVEVSNTSYEYKVDEVTIVKSATFLPPTEGDQDSTTMVRCYLGQVSDFNADAPYLISSNNTNKTLQNYISSLEVGNDGILAVKSATLLG